MGPAGRGRSPASPPACDTGGQECASQAWHTQGLLRLAVCSVSSVSEPQPREALISDANYHTNHLVIPRFLLSKFNLGESVSLSGRVTGATVWEPLVRACCILVGWWGCPAPAICPGHPKPLTGGFQFDFSPRLLAAQGQRLTTCGPAPQDGASPSQNGPLAPPLSQACSSEMLPLSPLSTGNPGGRQTRCRKGKPHPGCQH